MVVWRTLHRTLSRFETASRQRTLDRAANRMPDERKFYLAQVTLSESVAQCLGVLDTTLVTITEILDAESTAADGQRKQTKRRRHVEPPPPFGRLFLDRIQIGPWFESLADADSQGDFCDRLRIMMLEDRWYADRCWSELDPIHRTKACFLVAWWMWVTQNVACSRNVYRRTQIIMGMLFCMYPPNRLRK